MSWKFIVALAFAGQFLAPAANATADGPDYFQVRGDAGAELRSDKRIAAPALRILAKGDGKLRNLGCTGEGDDRWCKVEAGGVTGWVAARQLAEYAKPTSPSFDCAQAGHEAETLICKTPELMNLDNWLAAVFADAQRAAPTDAKAALQAEQSGWVKGRNDCWKAIDKSGCITDAYRHRIAELRARWQLVPPEQTVNFACDQGVEAVATFFNAEPLPAARLEIDGETQVFVGSPGTGETRYDGSFGRLLRVEGKVAKLIWDQGKPALACVAKKKP